MIDVESGRNGQRISTVECALCGAKQGEDFVRFPEHLLHDHNWGDLEIESLFVTDGGHEVDDADD